MNCKNCKKDFFGWSNLYDSPIFKFCSKDCYQEYRKKEVLEEDKEISEDKCQNLFLKQKLEKKNNV